MKKLLLFVFMVLIIVSSVLLAASCQPNTVKTGFLQGEVTFGPINPVANPDQLPPVPPEVISRCMILVYDEAGKNLIKEVAINQIGQTAKGNFTVELEVGTYKLNYKYSGREGGTAKIPRKTTIEAGKTTMVDITIDISIR